MVQSINDFDIEPYLNQLLEKNFRIQNLSDIEKVYTSKEYSQFITDVYAFFNNNTHEISQTKSGNNNYLAIRSTINHFWMSFLGPDLINKYVNRFKKS